MVRKLRLGDIDLGIVGYDMFEELGVSRALESVAESSIASILGEKGMKETHCACFRKAILI